MELERWNELKETMKILKAGFIKRLSSEGLAHSYYQAVTNECDKNALNSTNFTSLDHELHDIDAVSQIKGRTAMWQV